MTTLDNKTRSKIEAPNLAHLATVMKDGSPQVTPVWIGLENGNLTFNTAVGRVKERNIRRDPRVAISVLNVLRNAHPAEGPLPASDRSCQ